MNVNVIVAMKKMEQFAQVRQWNIRCAACALCYVMFCFLDIDECQMALHECAENATCLDTEGSYECACDPGFTGDGFNCTSTYVYMCIVLWFVCLHQNCYCFRC